MLVTIWGGRGHLGLLLLPLRSSEKVEEKKERMRSGSWAVLKLAKCVIILDGTSRVEEDTPPVKLRCFSSPKALFGP